MQTVHSPKAPSSEDPVLGGIIDRLVQIFRPERIYLFGSVARGDADPDSDFDLMIVVSDATPAAMRDTGPAYRALWRLGGMLALVVWARDANFSRRHFRAPFRSTV